MLDPTPATSMYVWQWQHTTAPQQEGETPASIPILE